MRLVVLNVGPQAVTVQGINAVQEDGSRTPLHGTLCANFLPELLPAPDGNVPLPVVIAAHEFCAWQAESEWVRRMAGSRQMLRVEVASYLPPRYWQRGSRSRLGSLRLEKDLPAAK
jgi:hypothetical protein